MHFLYVVTATKPIVEPIVELQKVLGILLMNSYDF